MSQNIYYSEWTGELGVYRIEFYPASTEVLDEPVYVELPEDCVIVTEFNDEFDKIPFGLSKAPTLKFKTKLLSLDGVSSEYRTMFMNGTKDLEMDFTDISPWNTITETITAGTVVKYSIPSQSDYFIGIILSDIDMDMDYSSGEIECEAVHFQKVALDCFGFRLLSSAPNGYPMSFESPLAVFEIFLKKDTKFYSAKSFSYDNNYFLNFTLLGSIFGYIGDLQFRAKNILLRQSGAGSYAYSLPSTKFYKTDRDNYSQLGDLISIAEIYCLAFIEKANNQKIGGLLYDGKAGLMKYASAWDFLSEFAENFMQKIYISENVMRIRPLFGKISAVQNIKNIDSDTIISAKPKLNTGRTPCLTASKVETISGDISKYEAVRASGRNGSEFTIPILFHAEPVACDYKKGSNNYNWSAFEPHIWGLYYKELTYFYKVHHYCDFLISNNRYGSDISAKSEYVPIDVTGLVPGQPKAIALLLQSESGISKWSAETFKALYDQPGQISIELEILPELGQFADYFSALWTVQFDDKYSELQLPEYWQCLTFKFDIEKERITLKLISVPENAI